MVKKPPGPRRGSLKKSPQSQRGADDFMGLFSVGTENRNSIFGNSKTHPINIPPSEVRGP